MQNTIIKVKTEELIPYQNNARTHSNEQIIKLRSSIREFGFVNPILIDSKFGIIAGHGRVMAAKAEGIEEIPCVIIDHLTEAQKKAYILADNRLALDAGWHKELLKIELGELKDYNFDLSLTGFDELEFDTLFSEAESLNLDEEPNSKESEKEICHCPKCGFEFEV